MVGGRETRQPIRSCFAACCRQSRLRLLEDIQVVTMIRTFQPHEVSGIGPRELIRNMSLQLQGEVHRYRICADDFVDSQVRDRERENGIVVITSQLVSWAIRCFPGGDSSFLFVVVVFG